MTVVFPPLHDLFLSFLFEFTISCCQNFLILLSSPLYLSVRLVSRPLMFLSTKVDSGRICNGIWTHAVLHAWAPTARGVQPPFQLIMCPSAHHFHWSVAEDTATVLTYWDWDRDLEKSFTLPYLISVLPSNQLTGNQWQ